MKAVGIIVGKIGSAGFAGTCLLFVLTAAAGDWPQYRGATTDGISAEPINTNWPLTGPTVVWTNMSLTNGFSTFAISQGRAYVLISKADGSGSLQEYCVSVDAATGTNMWLTPIDTAPWDPTYADYGGRGQYPYDTGDGPRTTPSIIGETIIALSHALHLVCLSAADGSVLWSNDLVAAFGASTPPWENAESPRFDNGLIFLNLSTANDNQTLAAFRATDGTLAWVTQNEGTTHATPIVATIEGVRQVLFPTQTGIVSLDSQTGNFLWKFLYPFFSISTSMGASPVVYSNIVYCTASYGRGATAAQVTLTGGVWDVQELWYQTGPNYRSIWMTPVCFEGYIYTLAGDNSTFLTAPLNCIELATGNLMWSTNNFGMGGLILVGNKLLLLTEDGQLVLVQPSPDGYFELARYQAFNFNPLSRGKCWNSPSFSNGRIYARSTTGAICLDASVAGPSPLVLLSPKFLSPTELQLLVGTAEGTPIDPVRLTKIELRASATLGLPRSAWPTVPSQLTLDPSGLARTIIAIGSDHPQQFYTAVEQP
jgi:outer membrane protein assembly factor BamB